MAVAKSYQSLSIMCEPYEVSGRMYVKVQMKNGNLKQVRWYSEKEYKSYYGEEPPGSTRGNPKMALGFSKGYITLIEGPVEDYNEYLRFECSARYSTFWGWYFVSEDSLPEDFPEDLKPVNLNWEQISENDVMFPKDKVKQIVDSILYEIPTDGYVGEVGQMIEVEVVVEKVYDFESRYGGYSTMHIMKDADGRTYVWTTSAKHWKAETTHYLRGKIKEHKSYKGIAQNILSHCREVQI